MNVYSCITCKDKSNPILKVANTLKLLSVDNRLKILCVLNQGEHCVSDLIKHFEMSQSLISHHLADLKEHYLVTDMQKGKNVYYTLTSKGKNLFTLLSKISEEI